MAQALALKLGYSHEKTAELNLELVETLMARSLHKQAALVLCSMPDYSKQQAVETFCKANCFMEAIREAMKESDLNAQDTLIAHVKSSVNLGFEVKKN